MKRESVYPFKTDKERPEKGAPLAKRSASTAKWIKRQLKDPYPLFLP